MASALGTRYDLGWVAEDEVRTKQLLLDMMDLLSSDPYVAMGLIPSATPADIRHAFLTRTKQFHPARFARMAPDIQRLANEVFLALRAVHETMAKPVVKASARPSPLAPSALAPRPTGAAGSAGMRPVGGPAPIPTTPPRAQTFPQAQLGTRPGTQPYRTTESSPGAASRTSPMQQTAPRSTVGTRAAGPPGGGPRPQAVAGAPAVAAPGIERELAPVYELFAQQKLGAAKQALEGLVARAPQSTKYRALLAYAKGRAAQVEKRIDEARVELHEALTLDPDLQLAKSALAELFTRRR